MEAPATIRQHFLQKRKAFVEANKGLLTPEFYHTKFSEPISTIIDKHFPDQPPMNVSAYWPLPSEVDSKAILEHLNTRNNIQCSLPIVVSKGEALIFRTWAPGDELTQRGIFNLWEPKDDKEVVDPDILVVPLVIFTSECFRVGFGGGHYDKTICGLKKKK